MQSEYFSKRHRHSHYRHQRHEGPRSRSYHSSRRMLPPYSHNDPWMGKGRGIPGRQEPGKKRSVTRSRVKPRGRGRGQKYVQQYYPHRRRYLPPQAMPPRFPAVRDRDSSMEPVVGKILQQLSYTKKDEYEIKDVVWVNNPISDTNPWQLCIVKYVLSDTKLIVRPFGKTQISEITITTDQIHETADDLSCQQLRRCIDSLKRELYNYYSIRDNHERDIYQRSLIKCKDDLYGEVLMRQENGKYTIQLSEQCTWYKGAMTLEGVPSTQVICSNEHELKYHILRRSLLPDTTTRKYTEDELNVYDFLGDVAELYIKSFLHNGIAKLPILLCLHEEDLREIDIKLGHRRYIMHKIKTFDAGEFKALRAQRDRERELEKKQERENKPECKTSETQTECIKLIVYDFNQTITSVPVYYEESLDEMNEEQMTAVFGGKQRLDALRQHFESLLLSNVEVVILSFAYDAVIKKVLKRAHLYEYLKDPIIIGSNSIEMQQSNGSKAQCIVNTFQKSFRNLCKNEILFVEDDPVEIEEAVDNEICKTLLIEPRQGMSCMHMVAIEKAVRGTQKVSNDEINVEDAEGASKDEGF